MISMGCIDVDIYNKLDYSFSVRTTNNTNDIYSIGITVPRFWK